MNVFVKYNGSGDSFIIPSWANVIGEEAFKECYLKYVSMIHVESISDYAFVDSEIDKIYINNGCKSIGIGSFMRSRFTEIILPESVTEIGKETFYGCPYLKLVIMRGVSEIPKECFANCTMLENVVHEAKIIGEDSFYNSGLTVAVIPDTVKEIKFGAFRHSKNLERVLISDSVQSISKFAFYGCNNLKEIVIPKGLYSNLEIFEGINPDCKFDLF
jgi:hypothetical protein